MVTGIALTEAERRKQMRFMIPIRDISNSIEKQKREFELRFDAPKGIQSDRRTPVAGKSKGLAWPDETEGTDRGEDRGGLSGCLLQDP